MACIALQACFMACMACIALQACFMACIAHQACFMAFEAALAMALCPAITGKCTDALCTEDTQVQDTTFLVLRASTDFSASFTSASLKCTMEALVVNFHAALAYVYSSKPGLMWWMKSHQFWCCCGLVQMQCAAVI
jgi:hypothetical protein